MENPEIEMSLDATSSIKGGRLTLELFTLDVLTPLAILSMIDHEIDIKYWCIEDMKVAKKRLKALQMLADYHINDYSACNTTYSKIREKVRREIKNINHSIKAKKELQKGVNFEI